MRERKRYFTVVAGEMQSGKTTHICKIADQYAKREGIVFAYNAGKPEDFSGYENIEVLTVAQTLVLLQNSKMGGTSTEQRRKILSAYKINPEILYFRHNNKIYHFKNFVNHFENHRNRRVKIKGGRLDRNDELLFFKTIFTYFANTLFVFDDCKAVFQGGLTQSQTQLLSRINHSGSDLEGDKNSLGCDFVMIYHNLDRITPEIYDYATDLRIFKTTQPPNYEKFPNVELAKTVKFCAEQVAGAPVWSYAFVQIIPLKYGERSQIKYNIIKPVNL